MKFEKNGSADEEDILHMAECDEEPLVNRSTTNTKEHIRRRLDDLLEKKRLKEMLGEIDFETEDLFDL